MPAPPVIRRRQYRLKVQAAGQRGVRMTRGCIQIDGVDAGDRAAIERLVTAWYRSRAKMHFHQRLEINRLRFPNPDRFHPTSLRIQRLAARWGSMSSSGRLTLNPDLIRAPVESIDYVITHELCHLDQPNHGNLFFELQGKVLPDWEQRKRRLERLLA